MHLLLQFAVLFAVGVVAGVFFITLHLEYHIAILQGSSSRSLAVLDHPALLGRCGAVTALVAFLHVMGDTYFGVPVRVSMLIPKRAEKTYFEFVVLEPNAQNNVL